MFPKKGKTMQPDVIEKLFTGPDGQYRFARWGRPIAPVIFGTDNDSLDVLKYAMQDVATLADMKLAETDPELGANFIVFFCQDWDELLGVPNLEKMLPDLPEKVAELEARGANQYRTFAFDDGGAIKMCTLVIRYDAEMASVSAQTLMTGQMAQSLLVWAPDAFAQTSPVGIITENNYAIVRPDIAALIRAAYDVTMPAAADDQTHALRLAARIGLLLGDGL